MKLEKDIILENQRLGIKTKFFSKNNGILGYTENGTVYINKKADDYELVNKHEILHLFEDTNQFNAVKKVALALLKDDLDKIRDKYYLKYLGLYTEDQIREGILDNEIVIDMIIGNGKFPVDINDYFVDAYEMISQRSEKPNLTAKGKRFLSLTVPKNTENRYSSLSKWDQIFVEEYYRDKPKPVGETRYDKIREDAVHAAYISSNFIPKEVYEIESKDNPYLDRKIFDMIESAETKGYHREAEKLRANKMIEGYSLADQYKKDLRSQYIEIADTLRKGKYSPSFIYLILKETATRTYRYEKGNRIVDKRIPKKTILPNMLLNKFVLDYLHENVDSYTSFPNMYFEAVEKYNKEFLSKSGVNFSVTDKGYWIRFEGGYDIEDGILSANASNLGTLIADTPWCTRKNPKGHLSEGDFYVFVDNYNKPRIAIKMKGDRIDEVRGVQGGYDQEVEDEYRDVAIKFLQENPNIPDADEWLYKEERNARMHEYLIKINSGKLTDEELIDLVKDLSEKEKKLHGGINTNEEALVSLIARNKDIRNRISRLNFNSKKVFTIIDNIERNIRMNRFIIQIENGTLRKDQIGVLFDDLLHDFNYEYEYVETQRKLTELVNSTDNIVKDYYAAKYKCLPSEIHVGHCERYRFEEENKVLPYKIVLGNLDLNRVKNADCSKLRYVLWDFKAFQSANSDFSNLVQVGGNVDVFEATNCDFSSLKKIGGDFEAYRIESEFPALEDVGGKAYLHWAFITDLPSLRCVGADLDLEFSYIKTMKNLREVGGRVKLGHSDIEDLPSLQLCEDFDDAPMKIDDQFCRDGEILVRKKRTI